MDHKRDEYQRYDVLAAYVKKVIAYPIYILHQTYVISNEKENCKKFGWKILNGIILVCSAGFKIFGLAHKTLKWIMVIRFCLWFYVQNVFLSCYTLITYVKNVSAVKNFIYLFIYSFFFFTAKFNLLSTRLS